MKAAPLIAIIFGVAVVLERDAGHSAVFWLTVAAGIMGVIAFMSAFRSRGGIGATGD